MKQDILVCALFSNQFTANYSVTPEFPLIKTMLISDYLVSSEEIIVEGF
jgi:7-keto-8-aminopelargonate synthetase-like enzyme